LAVGRGPRLAIVLLGISSSAALAQPVLPSSPVPPPGNAPSAADIVVTGKVADPAAVDREAKSFERDLQATPVGGQLARWHSAICPKVEGVDRLYGDMVAARIRQIARTAGADVGRNDCRPNIVVTFTPDAKGLIASIEKRDPRALSLASPAERAVIRSSPLPVRWWYTTLLEGIDGEQLTNDSALLSNQRGIPTGRNERYLSTYTSSLIDTKFRASITDVAVVVDVPYATGRRLDAVADYAAFVALGHVRVGLRTTTTPSILGLFDTDGTGRDTLTRWDVAYLSALYRTPAGRTADTQQNRIAAQMVSDLAK